MLLLLSCYNANTVVSAAKTSLSLNIIELEHLKLTDGIADMHSCSGGFLGTFPTNLEDHLHAPSLQLFSTILVIRNGPWLKYLLFQKIKSKITKRKCMLCTRCIWDQKLQGNLCYSIRFAITWKLSEMSITSEHGQTVAEPELKLRGGSFSSSSFSLLSFPSSSSLLLLPPLHYAKIS